MRICHVLEATGGGSALCVTQLVERQVAGGHDVTLIYAPQRADAAFKDFLAKQSGFKAIPLAMRRSVGLHDIIMVLRLWWVLRGLPPQDVLHGHSSKGGALARLVGLMFSSAVKIYTPHAFVTMGAEGSKLYGLIERLLGYCSDAIIVLSAQEKAHALRELKISAQKIYLVPNGLDAPKDSRRATARQILSAKDQDFIVGFVGRLVPQKNPQRALAVFAAIAMEFPRTRLVMIGAGSLEADIENQVRQLGLADKVTLLGGITAQPLIAGFDALLCASDYEGFAMIFLEALAVGVPIITTPVGGSHETVIEGTTGYIAEDFSAQSLAEKLRRLLMLDPTAYKAMAGAARAHADNFTIAKMAAGHETVYNSAFAARRLR